LLLLLLLSVLLLLLLLLLEQVLLNLELMLLAVKKARIGEGIDVLGTQIVKENAMLLLLTFVDPARNAHVRARLLYLRISSREGMSTLLLLLLLLTCVLKHCTDGIIGNLGRMHFKWLLRASLLLLEAPHIGLIQQLDHVEEIWLCLFDLCDIDAELTKPLL